MHEILYVNAFNACTIKIMFRNNNNNNNNNDKYQRKMTAEEKLKCCEMSVESQRHRVEAVVSDVRSLYCVHHLHKQRTHKKYIGIVCTDTTNTCTHKLFL